MPAADILQAGGRNSWENLSEAAPILLARGDTDVLVVTDKFHVARSMAIASSVGPDPAPDARPRPHRSAGSRPFRTTPRRRWVWPSGRIIGFDHLNSIHAFG